MNSKSSVGERASFVCAPWAAGDGTDFSSRVEVFSDGTVMFSAIRRYVVSCAPMGKGCVQL